MGFFYHPNAKSVSMYNLLKKFILRFFSKEFLIGFEPVFRSIYSIFYSGSAFQCNICDKKLRKFINLQNGNRICARCGSSDRDRKLWKLLSEKYLTAGINILDFSPSRPLFRKLNKIPHISYTATDFSGDFLSHRQYDITDIDESFATFDLAICYHVLEHIEDDHKAMDELFRVLKPSGICIIQTPFKEGDIYENPEINTDKERLKHFGQEDHLRVYSVPGLTQRLQNAGFRVHPLSISEPPDNKYGFKSSETILVCSKPSDC